MLFATKIYKSVKKIPFAIKQATSNSPIAAKSTKPLLTLKNILKKDTVELSNKAADTAFNAQKFAEQSPYLSHYLEFCNINKDFCNLDYFGVNLIKIMKKEPNRAKEFEQTAKRILEKIEQLKYSEQSKPYAVKNLLDLYYHNPEAFEKVLKSEKLIDLFYINGYQISRNISLTALKEMEKGSTDEILRYYVQNSDNVYRSPEIIKQLSEFLSKNTTEGAMQVTRAVKHAGAFDHVKLPDSMNKEIKIINRLLKHWTKKSDFSGYTFSYLQSDAKATNLYTHINETEQLSLADAMQMMKFLPTPLRKKVIEMIKNTKIIDNRFKSTTFNFQFIDKWLKNCNFQTTIQHNINIPKNTQGIYAVGDVANAQHEFIINNTPKEFSFTNVIYDEKKNRFILNSDMHLLSN